MDNLKIWRSEIDTLRSHLKESWKDLDTANHRVLELTNALREMLCAAKTENWDYRETPEGDRDPMVDDMQRWECILGGKLMVQGHRIYTSKGNHLFIHGPGQYGLDIDKVWYCCPPVAKEDVPKYVAALRDHKVIEHGDGTITVTPSIRIADDSGKREWHGFLERGFWREV